MRALATLYGALDRKSSPIEPALRSLITVRVSQINWCSFCVDINSATAVGRHVSKEKLADLAHFEDSELYSDREKAALIYAETVTHSEQDTTEMHFERLRCFFDDDAIIELTALDCLSESIQQIQCISGRSASGLLQCCAAAQTCRTRRNMKSPYQSMNVHELYPRWLVAMENHRACHLIDVRSQEEFCSGHVPGAELVSSSALNGERLFNP